MILMFTPKLLLKFLIKLCIISLAYQIIIITEWLAKMYCISFEINLSMIDYCCSINQQDLVLYIYNNYVCFYNIVMQL